MAKYIVQIPVTAYIEVEVIADSPKEAKEKGLEAEFSLEIQPQDKSQYLDLCDFELHKEICTGNVLHASLNQIDVIEVTND